MPHMRPYEVMVIFEATTDPTVIQGVLDQALEVIRSTGGNPGAIDRWGKRTFASGTQTVADLDRMLGLADEIVRHKIVRLPESAGGRTAAAQAAS
jgi:small subunit ribosomal protein S6